MQDWVLFFFFRSFFFFRDADTYLLNPHTGHPVSSLLRCCLRRGESSSARKSAAPSLSAITRTDKRTSRALLLPPSPSYSPRCIPGLLYQWKPSAPCLDVHCCLPYGGRFTGGLHIEAMAAALPSKFGGIRRHSVTSSAFHLLDA